MKDVICRSERRNVGIDERGEAEKQDEPGPLNSRMRTAKHGRSQAEGDDPERAGEFHGGANDQGGGSEAGGCADHGTGVVDGQSGPQSELLLGKVQHPSQKREDQKRNGIEDEHRTERYRGFFMISVDNGSDRGNGAAAADGGASGDQVRSSAADTQKLAGSQAHEYGESDAESRIDEATSAGVDNFVQIHAETQGHD